MDDDWGYPHDYGNLYMMDVNKKRWFFVTTHVWIIQFWWLRQNDRTLIWRFSFCHGVPPNHPSHGWPWPRIETYGDLGIPNFRTPPYVWKLELEVEVGDLEPWKMWKCQICSDGRATPTKRRGPPVPEWAKVFTGLQAKIANTRVMWLVPRFTSKLKIKTMNSCEPYLKICTQFTLCDPLKLVGCSRGSHNGS